MPNTYHTAPQVAAIADKLIAEHHDHLLTNAVYVKFLVCEQPEKVAGREALGTARKVGGLNAYLALRDDSDVPRAPAFDGLGIPLVSEFFLIIIYRDFWRTRSTTDHQRRALLDHELTHCWSEEQVDKDGNPTGKILLSILPHDIQEFHIIAERYGDWQPDITTFAKALRRGQPSLFDEEADDDEAQESNVKLTITHKGKTTHSTTSRLADVNHVLHDVAAGRGN